MKVPIKSFAVSFGALLFLGVGLIGCRSFLAGRVNADVRCGAMEYVGTLKANGILPGFTPKERGDFSMDAGKIILGVGVKYPLRVNINATKIPENAVWPAKIAKDAVWYCYELSKDAEGKEWRLIKAWKQGKEGGLVDLPLQGAAGIVTAPSSVTTNEPVTKKK